MTEHNTANDIAMLAFLAAFIAFGIGVGFLIVAWAGA